MKEAKARVRMRGEIKSKSSACLQETSIWGVLAGGRLNKGLEGTEFAKNIVSVAREP